MPHAAPRRALVLSSLLVCLGVCAEGMYKWVDDRGVTHYSESPPPEGTAAKKIEVQAGEGKELDWHKKLQDSNYQRTLKDQADKQQAGGAAKRQQECRRAQEALDTLNNSRRVYHLDDKGQRVYVDDEQRQKEIQMWQERAKNAC